jgi:hypothetical protein
MVLKIIYLKLNFGTENFTDLNLEKQWLFMQFKSIKKILLNKKAYGLISGNIR